MMSLKFQFVKTSWKNNETLISAFIFFSLSFGLLDFIFLLAFWVEFIYFNFLIDSYLVL